MVDTSTVIHVAYAISRRRGTSYLAKAYVMDRGVRHTYTTGIGDTADEAVNDAIRYIREIYWRDSRPAPLTVKQHGRMAMEIVYAVAF